VIPRQVHPRLRHQRREARHQIERLQHNVRGAIPIGRLQRVAAVAPGLVDTPLTATWTEAQHLWKDRAPMHRSATPSDIAQLVVMLVASDYLTGEIVLADGGLNLT